MSSWPWNSEILMHATNIYVSLSRPETKNVCDDNMIELVASGSSVITVLYIFQSVILLCNCVWPAWATKTTQHARRCWPGLEIGTNALFSIRLQLVRENHDSIGCVPNEYVFAVVGFRCWSSAHNESSSVQFSRKKIANAVGTNMNPPIVCCNRAVIFFIF